MIDSSVKRLTTVIINQKSLVAGDRALDSRAQFVVGYIFQLRRLEDQSPTGAGGARPAFLQVSCIYIPARDL